MEYKSNELFVRSDYEIRTIREDENDKDILISLKNRTVNFEMEDRPKFLNSRLQFLDVKNIIIRFSTIGPNVCTIHFLRSIDLHSSIVNFELNYNDYTIEIVDKEYFAQFNMVKRG